MLPTNGAFAESSVAISRVLFFILSSECSQAPKGKGTPSMINDPKLFKHRTCGAGRPQVLLYGNGLERAEGQLGWGELLNALRAPGVPELVDGDPRWDTPFPLLYQLLSTPVPGPPTLTRDDVEAEEKRLRDGLSKLYSGHIALLDKLPELCADHVLTTNYTYCLESTFLPRRNFSIGRARTASRFCLLPEVGGRPHSETCYRLHTGYLAANSDGSPVGLWHVHGEASVASGVIVGHDRYGRLLARAQGCCPRSYRGRPQDPVTRAFTSWPELFLFGDVYVIGLGMEMCETDLWWLLRRKQRERYADGRVYFFDNGRGHELRNQLLEAHGVTINSGIKRILGDYGAFYRAALDRIGELIQQNRRNGRLEKL